MGRQGSVGGPPPQGPVPVLAGLMDGNGCSIGTHILSYKPQLVRLGRRSLTLAQHAVLTTPLAPKTAPFSVFEDGAVLLT